MAKPLRHPITGCRPANLFGLWACEPKRMEAMVATAKSVDLVELMKQKALLDDREDKPEYQMLGNGIARLDVTGPLTKQDTSFQSVIGGTSTVRAQRAVRDMRMDSEVKGVCLVFDSPGGSVAGTGALGEEIARLAAEKPCVGMAEDLCASAALWCATQCTKLICNPTACVGSIGCYVALEDTSGMYAQAGVKVHVISTGPMKGQGQEGTPITPEYMAEWQKQVDAIGEQFCKAVSEGRGMSMKAVKELATGECWTGAQAVTAGLCDAVGSVDDAIDMLQSMITKGEKKKTASATRTPFIITTSKTLAEPALVKKLGALVEGPQGLLMPESIARQIESLSKGLPSDFTYRRKELPVGTFEARTERREEVSYITTDDVDREDEVILPAGMDDSQYNGTVTWCHRFAPSEGWSGMPVGQSLWRKKEAGAIKACTRYFTRPATHQGEWLPDTIVHLQSQVPPGCTGKSIGYIPISQRLATKAEKSLRPDWDGKIITDQWALVEYAVTPVPCNPSAEIAKSMVAAAVSGALTINEVREVVAVVEEIIPVMTFEQFVASLREQSKLNVADFEKQIESSVSIVFDRIMGRV